METSIRKRRPAIPDELSFPVADDVSIRRMRGADSREFFEMIDRNRRDFRVWLSWVDDIKCIGDIQDRYDLCLKSEAEGRSLRFFVIHKRAIIGMLAAKRIDWKANLAELSYSLNPCYRGRGIVALSCKVLIRYLSDELGIISYEIRTAVGNRPSERVAENLGFTFVEMREKAEWINGRWINHKIFANKSAHATSAIASR